MKFQISHENMLAALSNIMGAILKNPSLPILSCVKISVDQTKSLMSFEATNMDLKITSKVGIIETSDSATFCVEAGRVFDIVKKLKAGSIVKCELQNTKETTVLKISSDYSKFSVQCANLADYPTVTFQGDDQIKPFTISAKKLAFLIDKVKACVYPNETRFNLNGVLLHPKGSNTLMAISTDGHRLGICESEVSSEKCEFGRVILSKKSILELRKVLESIGDSDVSITISGKQAIFESGSIIFSSKLVDAEFPDYEKVLPKDNTTILTIPVKDFASAVQRVSAIYTNSSEIGVKFAISQNKITLIAKKSDVDVAEDEMAAEFTGENEINVTYNYIYLLELLSNISSKNVKIFFGDPKLPSILKDENLENYFYILMPMRD